MYAKGEVLPLHTPEGCKAYQASLSLLRGADLTGAFLQEGYFKGACFGKSRLAGADLSGANLHKTGLYSADFRGVKLCGANLKYANLDNTNFEGADLSGAELKNASFSQTKLNRAIGLPSAPVVNGLHGKIPLENVDMEEVDCGTVHCHAGWAIHLAGEEGRELQTRYGWSVAGALIIIASCPSREGRVPDFYDSDANAKATIEHLASIGE
jgi:hypothetical protein